MVSFANAITKLSALRNLKPGWNYGEGLSLSSDAFRLAVFILSHLQTIGASRFDILPTSDGGTTILASMNDSMAEIVILGEGSINLFLEDGDQEIDYESLQFGELIAIMEKQGWQSPTSSGSHTHSFTVGSMGASPVRRFRLTGQAHRSSTLPALQPADSVFVITSKSTTPESAESPQFLSGFRSQICQMELT
ncbi:MAG: hypothetical protein IPH79_05040 [Sphingomonadales bacterium]|nr:hypothetical protein [Sphingomonadales bacterium]